ncbi:MAG: CobD/CbiB family protein [Burkholderiales bacterium]
MIFLALIAALALEQLQPLRPGNFAHRSYFQAATALEHQFDAGERRHGMVAWLLAVVPVCLAAVAVRYALAHVNGALAWAWDVLLLYLALGFRQFSHHYTVIAKALRAGEYDRAREVLGAWRGMDTGALEPPAIARLTIEQGLRGAHRHVFGVLVWFLLLGAAGALAYRIAAVLAARWGTAVTTPEVARAGFGDFARDAFRWIEWLPARATAVSFAIVGNFEDAIYCWRTQAAGWREAADGIVQTAAAGALGVKLGGSAGEPEIGMGEPADVQDLPAAVGLIWRALMMWMFLILLATIASWF